jgi:hypothetical protein
MNDIKGVLRHPLTAVERMSDKEKKMKRYGAPLMRLGMEDRTTKHGRRYKPRQQGNKDILRPGIKTTAINQSIYRPRAPGRHTAVSRFTCPPPLPFRPASPVSPFIRPPSADGREARRAPARNFSTSRAALTRKTRKNAAPPPTPTKNSYIHFRTVFLLLGGCVATAVVHDVFKQQRRSQNVAVVTIVKVVSWGSGLWKGCCLSEGACELLVSTRQPRSRGKESSHLVTPGAL